MVFNIPRVTPKVAEASRLNLNAPVRQPIPQSNIPSPFESAGALLSKSADFIADELDKVQKHRDMKVTTEALVDSRIARARILTSFPEDDPASWPGLMKEQGEALNKSILDDARPKISKEAFLRLERDLGVSHASSMTESLKLARNIQDKETGTFVENIGKEFVFKTHKMDPNSPEFFKAAEEFSKQLDDPAISFSLGPQEIKKRKQKTFADREDQHAEYLVQVDPERLLKDDADRFFTTTLKKEKFQNDARKKLREGRASAIRGASDRLVSYKGLVMSIDQHNVGSMAEILGTHGDTLLSDLKNLQTNFGVKPTDPIVIRTKAHVAASKHVIASIERIVRSGGSEDTIKAEKADYSRKIATLAALDSAQGAAAAAFQSSVGQAAAGELRELRELEVAENKAQAENATVLRTKLAALSDIYSKAMDTENASKILSEADAIGKELFDLILDHESRFGADGTTKLAKAFLSQGPIFAGILNDINNSKTHSDLDGIETTVDTLVTDALESVNIGQPVRVAGSPEPTEAELAAFRDSKLYSAQAISKFASKINDAVSRKRAEFDRTSAAAQRERAETANFFSNQARANVDDMSAILKLGGPQIRSGLISLYEKLDRDLREVRVNTLKPNGQVSKRYLSLANDVEARARSIIEASNLSDLVKQNIITDIQGTLQRVAADQPHQAAEMLSLAPALVATQKATVQEMRLKAAAIDVDAGKFKHGGMTKSGLEAMDVRWKTPDPDNGNQTLEDRAVANLTNERGQLSGGAFLILAHIDKTGYAPMAFYKAVNGLMRDTDPTNDFRRGEVARLALIVSKLNKTAGSNLSELAQSAGARIFAGANPRDLGAMLRIEAEWNQTPVPGQSLKSKKAAFAQHFTPDMAKKYLFEKINSRGGLIAVARWLGLPVGDLGPEDLESSDALSQINDANNAIHDVFLNMAFEHLVARNRAVNVDSEDSIEGFFDEVYKKFDDTWGFTKMVSKNQPPHWKKFPIDIGEHAAYFGTDTPRGRVDFVRQVIDIVREDGAFKGKIFYPDAPIVPLQPMPDGWEFVATKTRNGLPAVNVFIDGQIYTTVTEDDEGKVTIAAVAFQPEPKPDQTAAEIERQRTIRFYLGPVALGFSNALKKIFMPNADLRHLPNSVLTDPSTFPITDYVADYTYRIPNSRGVGSMTTGYREKFVPGDPRPSPGGVGDSRDPVRRTPMRESVPVIGSDAAPLTPGLPVPIP